MIPFLPILARLAAVAMTSQAGRTGIAEILGKVLPSMAGAAKEGGVAEDLARKSARVVTTAEEKPSRRNYGPSAAAQGFASTSPDDPGVIASGKRHFGEQRVHQQLDHDDAIKRAAEAAKSLMGRLTSLGGVAGKILFQFGRLAFVGYNTARALEGFGNEVSEANRDLGKFNFGIASAFANLDFARQQREITKGQATEGSATALAANINALEAEFAGIKNDITTITNGVASLLVWAGRGIVWLGKAVGIATLIHGVAQRIDRNTAKDEKLRDPLVEFLDFFKGGRAGVMPPTPLPKPREPPAPLPPIMPPAGRR